MSIEANYKTATIAPVSTVRCAGVVRWKNGILQQLFILTDYVGGTPSAQREDWRDVPTHQ
jgi:hypothetical protein